MKFAFKLSVFAITSLFMAVILAGITGLSVYIACAIILVASLAMPSISYKSAQAVSITGTYAGEVLEAFLTLAITGNEIVDQGHIYVKSDVKDKFTLPRMQLDNIIQDRAATPDSSVGTFNVDEVALQPDDFMVYTEFNPREFEDFWRPFQPDGELVFRTLNSQVQVDMVGEVLKAVNNYMGKAILQGDKSGDAPFNKFDGIITKALANSSVVDIATPEALSAANVAAKMELVYKAIPIAIRNRPDLKMFVSFETHDFFQSYLINQAYKGPDETGLAQRRYKEIPIIPLVGMPNDTILCTYSNANRSSNLWLGVDMVNDVNTIQVDKVQNNSELYFFKMLMKADTQIGWGQHTILYKV